MFPRPPHAPARVATRNRERFRLELDDGHATTLHVAAFELSEVVPRLRVLSADTPLASWCRQHAVADAIVGGFFLRGAHVPLGELRINGAPADSVPFMDPWAAVRSCVHIVGHTVRIAPRPHIYPDPPGDLLQAGPLLVDGGEIAIDGADPEGFSSGAAQFDSDITIGRYPRAALGLVGTTLLAAVCEGRAADEAGLSLAELARAMRMLGAETAINLDGGGSTSLVLGGRLVNRPREEHGIDLVGGRPIATAIAFERI
jgi:Phosphodiester glycosidase